jgi:hypothetical protein
VFFESPVALAPGALNDVPDTNREQLAQNIYEWEQDGTGSCVQSTGCVYLISDGRDLSAFGTASSVGLLESDSTGENVFFTTADQLVPADTDTERDIYDARVEGGFPAPKSEEKCVGEACHPSITAPPVFGPLASLTFTGPGNPLISTIKPPGSKPKTAAQIRAEKLTRALRVCRRDRHRRTRVKCETLARHRYGPVKRAHKSNHGSGPAGRKSA